MTLLPTFLQSFRRRRRASLTAWALLLLVVSGLSACISPHQTDIFTALDTKGFVTNQAEVVAAADWKEAFIIEIQIRQNEFNPAIIRLFQGEPYILIVENRDQIPHILASTEFFKTTAIRKVLTEKEEISGANLIGLHLSPGEIKEIHFVPVLDGWYDFEGPHGGPAVYLGDRYFAPWSHGARRGMVGAFIVEP
jgi:hypothetical protein